MIGRGDIWLVNLDPTVGQEIKKTRPAVIISSNSIGKLPLKIIVPITDWKKQFSVYPWMVKLEPTHENGLVKVSSADSFQVRSIDKIRLYKKLGRISADKLAEITAGVVICIEHR